MVSTTLTSCESEVVLGAFLRKMLKTRGPDRSLTSSPSVGSVVELSIGSGSATSGVLGRRILSGGFRNFADEGRGTLVVPMSLFGLDFEAILLVLDSNSLATGKTSKKGCWNAIFTHPFQLESEGMNWSTSSSSYGRIQDLLQDDDLTATHTPHLISIMQIFSADTRIATQESILLHNAEQQMQTGGAFLAGNCEI